MTLRHDTKIDRIPEAKALVQRMAKKASHILNFLREFEKGELFRVQNRENGSTHIVRFAYMDTHGPYLVLQTYACNQEHLGAKTHISTGRFTEGLLVWDVKEVGHITRVELEDLMPCVGWPYVSEEFNEYISTGVLPERRHP
jgi:hypothetical protein